ncbi:MAG: FHA domain-containing protein [Ruminococcus sp.]|nr:FHA domain-containing protein [Ruminococcus sp.]
MNTSGYEITSGVSGNILSIPKNPTGSYDETAQKIFRSDCPYFAAPVTEVTINGETVLRYDIGNSKAVSGINMKMTGSEFIKLLKNLITPLTDCCDWMLDSHQFIMNTDLVFVSGYDYKVKYIYSFDNFLRCSDEDISGFFTEIIKKVRITDSAELSNSLLRMVVDGNVTAASLIDMVNRYNESNFRKPADNPAPAKREAYTDKRPAAPIRQSPEKDIQKKNSPKPEIKIPAIVSGLAGKPDTSEKKADISDELLSSERNEAMEKLFGNPDKKSDKKPVKKVDKKPAAKEKSKDSFLKFLKKDKTAGEKTQAVSSNFTHVPGENDETVFAGADGETELAGVGAYFILKEKKGELNAPSRVDIFLDGNGEMFIGRQCDNPEHGGYKFEPEFKKISRTHAKVTYDGMDYYITDMASANKTMLNGANLRPNAAYPLNEGDTVCFGDTLYTYEFYRG